MALKTISPPTVEPLQASEKVLREHLELTEADTFQDDQINAYCQTARDQAEVYLRRRLITQIVRLTLDRFGCGGQSGIPLPIAPVQSIDQVQYLDDAGTWQTMASTDYRLVDSAEPPMIEPAYGKIWPVPRSDRATVRIDLIVGYGDAASDLPPRFLQALRMQVAWLFTGERGDGDGEEDLCMPARRMLKSSILWV